MPRAIAHSELGASAGMSFASACMTSALTCLCSLLCLRSHDFWQALLSSVGGVAIVTIPRVIWARGARVRRFHSAALLALLGMRVEMDDSRSVFVIADSFWTV